MLLVQKQAADATLAVRHLGVAMADEDTPAKVEALDKISSFNRSLGATVPLLIEAQLRARPETTRQAEAAFQAVGDYASYVLKVVGPYANSREPEVAQSAAAALGELGANGGGALPPLDALIEPDVSETTAGVAYSAADGITKIDTAVTHLDEQRITVTGVQPAASSRPTRCSSWKSRRASVGVLPIAWPTSARRESGRPRKRSTSSRPGPRLCATTRPGSLGDGPAPGAGHGGAGRRGASPGHVDASSAGFPPRPGRRTGGSFCRRRRWPGNCPSWWRRRDKRPPLPCVTASRPSAWQSSAWPRSAKRPRASPTSSSALSASAKRSRDAGAKRQPRCSPRSIAYRRARARSSSRRLATP